MPVYSNLPNWKEKYRKFVAAQKMYRLVWFCLSLLCWCKVLDKHSNILQMNSDGEKVLSLRLPLIWCVKLFLWVQQRNHSYTICRKNSNSTKNSIFIINLSIQFNSGAPMYKTMKNMEIPPKFHDDLTRNYCRDFFPTFSNKKQQLVHKYHCL